MLTRDDIIRDLYRRADALDLSRVMVKHGTREKAGLFVAARALRVAAEQYKANQLYEPGDAVAAVDDLRPASRLKL